MHTAPSEMQQHACAVFCLFLFFARMGGCINFYQADFAMQMLPARFTGPLGSRLRYV